MSNENQYHIRVTMKGDVVVYHMMYGDLVERELTAVDIINLIMNASSSLRWGRK